MRVAVSVAPPQKVSPAGALGVTHQAQDLEWAADIDGDDAPARRLEEDETCLGHLELCGVRRRCVEAFSPRPSDHFGELLQRVTRVVLRQRCGDDRLEM